MIYGLYHLVTRTRMGESCLPWYCDVIGGLVDAAIVFAVFTLAVTAL